MKGAQRGLRCSARYLSSGSKRAVAAALLGAVAVGVPAGEAAAQVGAPAQEAETATTDDGNVIIVTAQRRQEALEDVPMTVSVVTPETMAAAGITSLRDIQNVTTGLQLGQGGGFPQPAIRGVTTVLSGTFENNVAVYIDGFYQVAPQSLAIDLPNVESVQVLKGPQGTLYGRNATGGAILLSTISPDDTWRGKTELTYARFDDKRVSGYVAGPISDTLGVSLAGYFRRSDGYTKLASRTTPGETEGNAAPLEQDSIRFKLRNKFGENLSATVGFNYTHTNDPRGLLFTPYENVALALAPVAATLPNRLGVAAWDYGTTLDTKQSEFTLALELDTGIGTLQSYTGLSVVRTFGTARGVN